MTVKEFCEKYKISHQAVYKKIGRNRDKLKGHIFKSKGKIYELDPTAVEILKPKSVYYKQLDDRNYHLYKKNEKLEAESKIQNEKIENLNESLSDKMSRICKLIDENAELKSENESLMEKVSNLETEISRINIILHSAKESLAAVNAKYEELSKQLVERNDEILSLREQLGNVHDENILLKAEIERMTDEIEQKNTKKGIFGQKKL